MRQWLLAYHGQPTLDNLLDDLQPACRPRGNINKVEIVSPERGAEDTA
jgi:hypothetical protein